VLRDPLGAVYPNEERERAQRFLVVPSAFSNGSGGSLNLSSLVRGKNPEREVRAKAG
jgi:hypothetical protein